MSTSAAKFDPRDPLGIDAEFTPEQLAIRDSIRALCSRSAFGRSIPRR